MKVYVEAKSKAALIRRLAAGEEISGYNYSMFGGGGHYMLDDTLEDGTIIAIYSQMSQGNPVAKSWGTWTNGVLKAESFNSEGKMTFEAFDPADAYDNYIHQEEMALEAYDEYLEETEDDPVMSLEEWMDWQSDIEDEALQQQYKKMQELINKYEESPEDDPEYTTLEGTLDAETFDAESWSPKKSMKQWMQHEEQTEEEVTWDYFHANLYLPNKLLTKIWTLEGKPNGSVEAWWNTITNQDDDEQLEQLEEVFERHYHRILKSARKNVQQLIEEHNWYDMMSAETFEAPVSCKICGKTFDSFRGLNGHMNAHLPSHRKRAETFEAHACDCSNSYRYRFDRDLDAVNCDRCGGYLDAHKYKVPSAGVVKYAETFEAEEPFIVRGTWGVGVVEFSNGDVFVKVITFPVTDDSGFSGESMWVILEEGNEFEGIGILDNDPVHSEIKSGSRIKFTGGNTHYKPHFVAVVEAETFEAEVSEQLPYEIITTDWKSSIAPENRHNNDNWFITGDIIFAVPDSEGNYGRGEETIVRISTYGEGTTLDEAKENGIFRATEYLYDDYSLCKSGWFWHRNAETFESETKSDGKEYEYFDNFSDLKGYTKGPWYSHPMIGMNIGGIRGGEESRERVGESDQDLRLLLSAPELFEELKACKETKKSETFESETKSDEKGDCSCQMVLAVCDSCLALAPHRSSYEVATAVPGTELTRKERKLLITLKNPTRGPDTERQMQLPDAAFQKSLGDYDQTQYFEPEFSAEGDEPTIEEFFRDMETTLDKYGAWTWDSEASDGDLHISVTLTPTNEENFYQYDLDFDEMREDEGRNL